MRALVIWTVLAAVAGLAAVLYGRAAGWIALASLSVLPLGMWIWLPRAGHRAFRRGDFKRARMWYRALRLTTLSARSRAAIEVSLAACGLATEDFAYALRVLAEVDRAALGDAARAAWLNNRAYALARSGGDVDAALRCSEQAIALRPDVAGFRHTRGVALLAVGRLDDAIRELERLWDDLSEQISNEYALLECERCYDLGVAWQQKGDAEYAADYFRRAHQVLPGSRWARRALTCLRPDEHDTSDLPDESVL